MNTFYAIHIQPWLIAGRSLLPRRPFVSHTNNAERTMNILGLKVSVDDAPSAKVRWTRRTGAMAATTAVVLAGGVAYASWSTNGTGSGSATAAAAATVTVGGSGTASTTGLFPG